MTETELDTTASGPEDISPGKTPAAPTPAPAPVPPKAKKRGGWFRRLFFVFLLMLVTAGIVVSAVLLRQRLDAVLSDVDGLANQLEETRNNLSDTQQELDDTKQALEELETDTQAAILALAADSEAALLALETRMVYGFHAQQAMAETTKAIQSLTQDDLGQARREITALRASLVAAAGFASEEDAVLLSDLESRASQAEADLTINAFAAQQTLEVIWRDLDELTASLSAQAAP